MTVAVDGETVVGFGSLSLFNKREGYRFTVENTVYVHPEHHRRGIGRALLADLSRAHARSATATSSPASPPIKRRAWRCIAPPASSKPGA